MTYVVPLSRVGLADADRVGRKAAVLGALLQDDFPVPDGFAVTGDALSATIGDDRALTGAAILSAAPPAQLVAEIAEGLRVLGADAVAVRSSSVNEDTEGMSYAGQYESYLDVRGLDAVLDAVRRCWASAFTDRVAAYRGEDGGDAVEGHIGVLVQRMVPARAAGVAFSVNPLTGNPDETVVNAVSGLADQLMSGEATPEEWVVRDGTAVCRSGGHDALDAETVGAVAALTARVAQRFDAPQDVEWAIAGETIWLVQARPITALPEAGPEEVPIEIKAPTSGFWGREPSLDKPWTPLQTSIYLPVLGSASRHMFAFTSGGIPEAREIGGWVYLSMSQEEDSAKRVAQAERVGAALADGEPIKLVRRWHDEWRPAFAERIAELRDVDLGALSDWAFESHFRTLTKVFAELHDVYFRLVGSNSVLLGTLGQACQELLGWSPQQTLRLRSGLVGAHMDSVVRLGQLAELAAKRPAVRELLEDLDAGTPGRLREVDPEFADAFDSYLADHGHRVDAFDITEPTLAEQPTVLLSLIVAQLEHPFNLAEEKEALRTRIAEAVAEADALLADRPEADRARFRAALADSDEGTSVRDEKVYYAVSAWALLRYAALELGERLTTRELVTTTQDVFFLRLDESLTALRDGIAHHDLIRTRRGQFAWASTHEGPRFYGTPPSGPPMTEQEFFSLSAEGRHAMEVSLWTMSLWGGGPAPESDDETLRGTAASAGRYTGPVRVITKVAEFAKLRHGDVLVCPETTAQWAPLFPTIGALVADRGGLLSHPAIIAREYGVPAVVAVGDATTRLKDGQLVTVDGTAGTIRPAGHHLPVNAP